MESFISSVTVRVELLPHALVEFYSTRFGHRFCPTDEIDEVSVSVDFVPGWSQRGNRSGHPDNWSDDEGEPAEVLSVTVSESGYPGHEDIMPALSTRELARLRHETEQLHNDYY